MERISFKKKLLVTLLALQFFLFGFAAFWVLAPSIAKADFTDFSRVPDSTVYNVGDEVSFLYTVTEVPEVDPAITSWTLNLVFNGGAQFVSTNNCHQVGDELNLPIGDAANMIVLGDLASMGYQIVYFDDGSSCVNSVATEYYEPADSLFSVVMPTSTDPSPDTSSTTLLYFSLIASSTEQIAYTNTVAFFLALFVLSFMATYFLMRKYV